MCLVFLYLYTCMFGSRPQGTHAHLTDQFTRVTLIYFRLPPLCSSAPSILSPHDTQVGDYFPPALPCFTLQRPLLFPASLLFFPPSPPVFMERQNEATCRGEPLWYSYIPATSLFPSHPPSSSLSRHHLSPTTLNDASHNFFPPHLLRYQKSLNILCIFTNLLSSLFATLLSFLYIYISIV